MLLWEIIMLKTFCSSDWCIALFFLVINKVSVSHQGHISYKHLRLISIANRWETVNLSLYLCFIDLHWYTCGYVMYQWIIANSSASINQYVQYIIVWEGDHVNMYNLLFMGRGGVMWIYTYYFLLNIYTCRTTIEVTCLLSVEFMTHPYQRIRLNVYYLIMDPTT